MDISILKSDIFFFVTTVCVVLVSGVFLIALFYIVSVLRDIKYISNRVKEEGEAILSDAKELRETIKEKSGGIISLILSFLAMRAKRKRKKE